MIATVKMTMTFSELTTTMRSTDQTLFVLSTNLLTKVQAIHLSKVVTVTTNSLASQTHSRVKQKNALLKDKCAQIANHAFVAPTRYQWQCFAESLLWFLWSVSLFLAVANEIA